MSESFAGLEGLKPASISPESIKLATAVHEAGHAVAAFRLKLRVGKVTIKPNIKQDYLGFCEFDHLNYRTSEQAERRIIALYAGGAAVDHFLPGSRIVRTQYDDERARLILRKARKTEEALRAEAARIIADDADLVRILFRELLWERTLPLVEWYFIALAHDRGMPWRESVEMIREAIWASYDGAEVLPDDEDAAAEIQEVTEDVSAV